VPLGILPVHRWVTPAIVNGDIMKRTFYIYFLSVVLFASIITVVFFCLSINNHASDSSQESLPKETNKLSKSEINELFDDLVSHNPKPEIKVHGDSRRLIPPENFSWKENLRVKKNIQIITDHVEELWPELVSHLDDERYSVSVPIAESRYTFSVGGVCYKIICDTLAEAHFSHMKDYPMDLVYNRLGSKAMSHNDDNISLEKWLMQRKTKPLYELQIEKCEWAIREMGKLKKWFSDEDYEKTINEINQQIEEHRKTKKPVLNPKNIFTPKSGEEER
jgi:hypothetical protein